MTRNVVFLRWVAALSVAPLIFGCQAEPKPLPEVFVAVPEQFEDGGTMWQKQASVQPADNDCLATFFVQNQELAGSPEFEGPPTVFHSGKNDRRFYWLLPSADVVGRWRCIEFRNRKYSTSDGLASPFE